MGKGARGGGWPAACCLLRSRAPLSGGAFTSCGLEQETPPPSEGRGMTISTGRTAKETVVGSARASSSSRLWLSTSSDSVFTSRAYLRRRPGGQARAKAWSWCHTRTLLHFACVCAGHAPGRQPVEVLHHRVRQLRRHHHVLPLAQLVEEVLAHLCFAASVALRVHEGRPLPLSLGALCVHGGGLAGRVQSERESAILRRG